MLYIRTWVEFEETLSKSAVVIEHEKDAPTADSGVFGDDFHVSDAVVGQEIEGMRVDGEIKAVVATLFIDEDIFPRGIWE